MFNKTSVQLGVDKVTTFITAPQTTMLETNFLATSAVVWLWIG